MRGKSATRGNLVVNLATTLRDQIEHGEYDVGNRLPTEAQLSEQHGVSRTVVREAIAALRSDGLVEPRQGAGVFVLRRQVPGDLPFSDVDLNRVSSVIEMLELRTAVEVEVAGLAAVRRSPAQEERIMECHELVSELARAGASTSEADFALHLAIADATNNARFREFLEILGPKLIPRRALRSEDAAPVSGSYQSLIDAEHASIVNAIVEGDSDAARLAMRRHLEGSTLRYRKLLWSARADTAVPL